MKKAAPEVETVGDCTYTPKTGQRCSVDIREEGRWPRYHQCTKNAAWAVKNSNGETEHMCNLHKAAHKRRASKSVAWEQSYKQGKKDGELSDRRIKALVKKLGIDVFPAYTMIKGKSDHGRCQIRLDDLERLAARLEAAEGKQP